jgi:hypothetical protein
MASPPLIAALACLVVLYSRREPSAALTAANWRGRNSWCFCVPG